MARTPAKPPAPVLYLLDEFAALGHLAPVERAMGLMAGYGVQLWPILQDIHQLRATYGQRAGTFLSNAGVLQVFGVNDHDSARLVSDLLGQETVVFQTTSRALDAEDPASPSPSTNRPAAADPRRGPQPAHSRRTAVHRRATADRRTEAALLHGSGVRRRVRPGVSAQSAGASGTASVFGV